MHPSGNVNWQALTRQKNEFNVRLFHAFQQNISQQRVPMTNATETPQPTAWWHCGFPGRETGMFATYAKTPYGCLPEIEIDALFADIESVEDVKKNRSMLEKHINSPTSCFFVFDEPHLFYSDQQGCIVWYFQPERGVYTNKNVYTGENECVAKTIPEFLTRMHIEDSLWFHGAHPHKFTLSPAAQKYLVSVRKIGTRIQEVASLHKKLDKVSFDASVLRELHELVDRHTDLVSVGKLGAQERDATAHWFAQHRRPEVALHEKFNKVSYDASVLQGLHQLLDQHAERSACCAKCKTPSMVNAERSAPAPSGAIGRREPRPSGRAIASTPFSLHQKTVRSKKSPRDTQDSPPFM